QRLSKRFRALPRRAKRRLDLLQEHAGSAHVDVPAAASHAECRGAPLSPMARPGQGGHEGQGRRAARTARSASPADTHSTKAQRWHVGASSRADARSLRAVCRAISVTFSPEISGTTPYDVCALRLRSSSDTLL